MYRNANGRGIIGSHSGLLDIGGSDSNSKPGIKQATAVIRKALVKANPALSVRQQPLRAVRIVSRKDRPHTSNNLWQSYLLFTHLMATEHKGFLVVVDQDGDTTILGQDHSFLRSFFKYASFVASIQTDLYSTTKKNNKAA